MIQEFNIKINNETIKGYQYKPENIKQKLPLLILSHGFFANHTWLTNYAETLVKHNIICYTFDFRGGGPDIISDGTLEDSSVLTETEDLNKIINELSKQEIVNTEKIYLLGHSQGGLVSALTATRNNIQALFLLAPAYNIPYEMTQMDLPAEGVPIKNMVGIFTRKFIADARKIRIYDDVTEFSNKVIIFHGNKDKLVPIHYSKEAIKEYMNAELYVMENENHNFSLDAQQKVIEHIIKEINGKEQL